MGTKPHIRVAAAVIVQNGLYLITRRNKGVHLEGLWEFPGGKCEASESMETCLRRELIEELGIQVTQPRFFMRHDHEYPEKTVELHFWTCSIQQGRPEPLGCAEFCWVRAEELSNFEFPPADVPVLSRLLERSHESQHTIIND